MSALDLSPPGRPARQRGAKFFGRANVADAVCRISRGGGLRDRTQDSSSSSAWLCRRCFCTPCCSERSRFRDCWPGGASRWPDALAGVQLHHPQESFRPHTDRLDGMGGCCPAAACERGSDGCLQTPQVFTLQVGSLVRTHPFILAGPASRQSITASRDATGKSSTSQNQKRVENVLSHSH